MATPTTNFVTFNPSLTNAETDSQYASDQSVTGGLTNGVASPTMHNKLFHQATIMAKALANVLVNHGQSALDTSESALTTAITAALIPAQVATAAIGASQQEVMLTSTSQTAIATYIPGVNQNLLIGISVRIANATTIVSAEVDYTDASGSQAIQFYTDVSMPVGANPTLMILINAVANQPVTVKATAGTANNAYMSASIVEV